MKLSRLSKLVSFFIRIVFSFQVSPGVKIGREVKFGYGGLGCVIHGDVVLEDGVTIGSNVTLGGNFNQGGVPYVCEGAYIATGARVLGKVIIGSNSIVGANSVVTRDVEPSTIVAGCPAKVIRRINNEK